MFRPVLKCIAALLFVILLSSTYSSPSEAAKLRFGPVEQLQVIEQTKILVDGKLINLCYKTYSYFILAGVYTTDEYVLCEGGGSLKYGPMPKAAQLAALQQKGLITSPLPNYQRPAIDYLIGYSLWILLGVLATLWWLGRLRSKAKGEKVVLIMKAASRRVMAWMMKDKPTNLESSFAAARKIYQSLFAEPLLQGDLESDLQWVRDNPTAFDNYLGAIGRKLNRNGKFILLQSGTQVILVDGVFDGNKEAAIHHVGKQLGMFREEVENFIDNLRERLPPPVPQNGP
ncbi:MAG: PDGLE domain-containing protein [Alphaproteobacteria bacterium]|nr:PDGLE domain-containing protein [Alphaproteobacteria bacterium]